MCFLMLGVLGVGVILLQSTHKGFGADWQYVFLEMGSPSDNLKEKMEKLGASTFSSSSNSLAVSGVRWGQC